MRTAYRVVIACLLASALLVLPTSCFIMRLFPQKVTLFAGDIWMATRITVRAGDELFITATGTVKLYDGHAGNGPNGDETIGTPSDADPANAGFYPLRNELTGALVARIGADGLPFLVGSSMALRAATAGQLYLTVNDNIMTNNSGFFAVVVEFTGGIF